jgi:hypothetical protein
MSKAAIPIPLNDQDIFLEYSLQAALVRTGLAIEHRRGGYVILSGCQVLLDRDRDGGGLSLEAAIGFMRKARLLRSSEGR